MGGCIRLALVAVFLLTPPHVVRSQEPIDEEETPVAGEVMITSPSYGEIASGMVLITGTAIAPDFHHYELAFAFSPNEDDQWFPVQVEVAQQVRDGILGAWDTARLADGPYLLRLRVVRNDGTTQDTVIAVQAVNATPTPPPTLPPPPTVTATPTAGPTSTPLIQQPPTRTPHPTTIPGGPTPTPRPRQTSPFDRTQLRRAACVGIYLTLGAFGMLGLYLGGKSVVRRRLRLWWYRFWQSRKQ